MARNPGTRMGRPPKMGAPVMAKLPSGEKQGIGPSEGFDTAYPAKAFPRGMAMPKHHDDPKFCSGGSVKRR